LSRTFFQKNISLYTVRNQERAMMLTVSKLLKISKLI
jgi:hypothetical protein